MGQGRRIAADLDASGRPLNRTNLRTGLRAAGVSASNERTGTLLARLRADPNPTNDEHQDASGTRGDAR
jgi:hypothetical protein